MILIIGFAVMKYTPHTWFVNCIGNNLYSFYHQCLYLQVLAVTIGNSLFVMIYIYVKQLSDAVSKIRKNIYRSNVQVTFELYGHFRWLQILYSK